MSSVSSEVLVARESIFQTFRSFPIAMLITLGLLGAFQGNINLMFFSVGMGVLAPLAAFLVSAVIEFAVKTLTGDASSVVIQNGPACSLFDATSFDPYPLCVYPTIWTTMTSFFFAYLMWNASDIYTRPTPKGVSPVGVNARKKRTAVSMFSIAAIFVLVMSIRLAKTQCETPAGLLVGIVVGGLVASSWFNFMRNCGFGRFDDIFGISNRLLSPEANETVPPTVCVPTTGEKPKCTDQQMRLGETAQCDSA